MPRLLINIDVPDLASGEAFYTRAFNLRVGRRMGDDFLELLGMETPLYLLLKREQSPIGPGLKPRRTYERHWSPIHPDIVVEDLDVAIARVLGAGAVMEVEPREEPYGRIAMFADPFGHGFCLIELNEKGYDAIVE